MLEVNIWYLNISVFTHKHKSSFEQSLSILYRFWFIYIDLLCFDVRCSYYFEMLFYLCWLAIIYWQKFHIILRVEVWLYCLGNTSPKIILFPVILKYSLQWNGRFPDLVFKTKCLECGHGTTTCIDTSKSFPRGGGGQGGSKVEQGEGHFSFFPPFFWSEHPLPPGPFPKQKCSTGCFAPALKRGVLP